MSRFFSEKYSKLTPYVPGEQPRDRSYNKLNTNESPFPPSPLAQRLARQAAGDLQLYSDPECLALKRVAAERFGISEDEIIFTNSSDETLSFLFMAFCDSKRPAVFADITYGFYRVFAARENVPFREIPLRDDFSIDVSDYMDAKGTVFIANPNAPTGLALSASDIERIAASNPDNVVVVDEAYVDFGAESCLPLIKKYGNLIVTQTFSKSRSLAGGRLGFAAGNRELIADINTIKYSVNPYDVNRMSMAAGIGALLDEEYFRDCCERIKENRAYTQKRLAELGFEFNPSLSNFVFARRPGISGEELYLKLKARGVLIRHFGSERLRDHIRITIGSREQMDGFFGALEAILSEAGLI